MQINQIINTIVSFIIKFISDLVTNLNVVADHITVKKIVSFDKILLLMDEQI